MATLIKADRRKTTNLLKKHLLERFNIIVSIRSEIYSGGSSLNIDYANGISPEEVEKVVNNLQEGHFNGMEDIYEYSKDSGLTLEEHELETFKYVFVGRKIDENLKFQLCQALAKYYNFEESPILETPEDMYKYFGSEISQKCGSNDWSNLLHRFANKGLNFCTQDAEKIKIIEVSTTETERENGFIYEFEGLKYHTREPIVLKKETKATPAPVNVEPGKIKIIEYSEKAIAVIGDTKPIKEKLKQAGGSFNMRLTCGPGWIFSRKRLEELTQILKAN